MWRFLLRHPLAECRNARVVRHIFGLLLISHFAGSLAAQSVQRLDGAVQDGYNHLPIPNATITVSNSSFITITDQFGRFSFAYLPTGNYTLVVGASGYQGDTINTLVLTEDQPTTLTIVLEPEAFPMPDISVNDRRDQPKFLETEIITKEEIDQSNATTLPQLLSTLPELLVQDAGNGQVTVSVRGGENRHLLVLLDGHRLNDAGTNLADLSAIPLSMIERIEIEKGGASAESGTGAIAGIISISTHPISPDPHRTFAASRSAGSWGVQRSNFMVENPVPVSVASYRFAFSDNRGDGNFPFSYQVAPRPVVYSGDRINNWHELSNYFLSGLLPLSRRASLSFSGYLFESSNGLPGRASQQTETADRSDNRKLVTSQLDWDLSRHIALAFSFSGSRSKQKFTDTQTGISGYRTEYQSDLYKSSLTSQIELLQHTSMQLGLETQLDEVNGEDLLRPQQSIGTVHRTASAAFLFARQSIPTGLHRYLHPLTIDGAIRFDQAATGNGALFTSADDSTRLTRHCSPKVGAGVSFGSTLLLSLNASYGKSFSLPELYSLFWKGDTRSQGNPYLRPEQAEHSDINLHLGYEHPTIAFDASVSYFHTNITDLIVWVAGFNDIWKPENLASARITGTEQTTSVRLFKRSITIEGSRTSIVPLNRTPGPNSYNNDLTYRPRHQSRVSAKLNLFDCYLSYAIRWVDKSYALASNTKWYEGYRLDDLAFGTSQHFAKRWRVNADARIDNIQDKDYVLVTHYPMPGRTWQVSFGLEYLIGKLPVIHDKQTTDTNK